MFDFMKNFDRWKQRQNSNIYATFIHISMYELSLYNFKVSDHDLWYLSYINLVFFLLLCTFCLCYNLKVVVKFIISIQACRVLSNQISNKFLYEIINEKNIKESFVLANEIFKTIYLWNSKLFTCIIFKKFMFFPKTFK